MGICIFKKISSRIFYNIVLMWLFDTGHVIKVKLSHWMLYCTEKMVGKCEKVLITIIIIDMVIFKVIVKVKIIVKVMKKIVGPDPHACIRVTRFAPTIENM